MTDMFTPKQEVLLSMLKHDQLKRINILEGSVRSGKTWISLVLWAFWVATMPADGAYLMVAKTLTSLKRNCLDLLQSLVGEKHFIYNISTKEGRLFGRLIYLEGVNDARAEGKIRGMTLTGAYCDELTLFTENFFSMLLSRLSDPGAKLIGTTNPDTPMHWLKAKYINRREELDMLTMQFLIDDNTMLDQAYVASLKKEYTGVFYDRFILGKWVIADGVIYDMFTKANVVTDADVPIGMVNHPATHRYIAIDYGTSNATAFLDIYDDGQRIWVLREYYYSGRDKMRQKTDSEYANDLIAFGGDAVIYNILDPSALSFKAELRKRGLRVKDADNEVLDGIRVTSTLLASQKLLIHERCSNLIAELQGYIWDEKAQQRGVEQPVKVNDHACITGDTLIDTLHGQIPIKELVGTSGKVFCYDEKHKRKVLGDYKNVCLTQRDAEIYEITLATGKVIRATADHPILTARGWVPVSQLTVQDKIVKLKMDGEKS